MAHLSNRPALEQDAILTKHARLANRTDLDAEVGSSFLEKQYEIVQETEGLLKSVTDPAVKAQLLDTKQRALAAILNASQGQ
jgi:hypothetical protein